MFTLFSRIFLSNWRSLSLLFLIILIASTGFLTLRQITANIEKSVASETRPLFGADILVSPRGYASGDILPLVAESLKGEDYRAAERREFSTTLFDTSGKTWLVQVVAYSGSYPQRGILKLEGEDVTGWVVVTPGLRDKFASWWIIEMDGRKLKIDGIIKESSDLGFSLGTENHLIVLPSSSLSGSNLLSSWSRLDHDLYLTFIDESRAKVVAERIKIILPEELYRTRTYEERTERNLDTVETLTDYITLILFVSSIFAFIILRSAHESFFESLAKTLSVTEILGLPRRKQRILLLLLYSVLFPLAFLVSIGIADLIIVFLQSFPDASEFQFFWSALPRAFFLLLAIVIIAWFPVWWTMGGKARGGEKRRWKILLPENSLDQWSEFRTILITIKNAKSFGERYRALRDLLKNMILQGARYLLHTEIIVQIILGIFILFLLFGSPIFSFFVGIWAFVFFVLFWFLLRGIYLFIFRKWESQRNDHFYRFDALRTLVRPLTPTIPISISLVSVTVFFLVFASFSLAFRAKLVVDSTNTANIYAINILEGDVEKVRSTLGESALMYDILRARIMKINGETLESHFDTDRVSGEFTREFNVTTTPLENDILKGKNTFGPGEISVDNDFSKRLGVSVGDRVTFLLSWREITLEVANIRESVREGFRPFFYFSFDPDEFKNAPRTYFVAEYASDTEAWKKTILENSGPHVTFIDIESVLKIVRDISGKVLSVIWLFFAVVFVFALGAIIAFFTRMRPVENMKKKLYTLFGAKEENLSTTIAWSRITIFALSYILSILLGGILSYFVLSSWAFFSFSFSDYLLLSLLTFWVYGIMVVFLRK
jgi:predicted lysophospholipase L1 biosynthesis ABC-type transport system permease subunit